LAEEDNGGFPDWFNKFVEWVREKVYNYVEAYLIAKGMAAVGAVIGAALLSEFPIIGTIIGAVVGAAVGCVLGKFVEFLKIWWEDDTFDPITLQETIPVPNAFFSN
jgi:hypothetical protein